jgi:hypothetical protein
LEALEQIGYEDDYVTAEITVGTPEDISHGMDRILASR